MACPEACTLTLGSLFSDRDMHAVHTVALDLGFELDGERATVCGQQPLKARIWAPSGKIEILSPTARPQRVYLPMEPARGGPETDQSLRPDLWRVRLPPGGGRVALVVDGLGEADLDPWDAEVERRAELVNLAWATSGVADEVVATLALAADAFVVWRASTAGTSLIAGYPWFADWGRDSMIALDGLVLQTGRFAEDGTGARYNTADGALWLALACRRYVAAKGDLDFTRWALPRLRESLN